VASSLSAVFTESPFDDGYDLSIGTSERGVPLSSVLPSAGGNSSSKDAGGLPDFSHLLIVFGGVAGLEVAVSADSELLARGISRDNVSDLFDAWVNVVPGQGSRTIRTEEAVWVALMGLQEFVQNKGR
jgi:methyltransferase